jgi:hypothetical protein
MGTAISSATVTLRNMCFIGFMTAATAGVLAQTEEDTLNIRLFDHTDLLTGTNNASNTVISANRLADFVEAK